MSRNFVNMYIICSIFNFCFVCLFIFSFETVRKKIVVARGSVSRVDLKMKREASGKFELVMLPQHICFNIQLNDIVLS